MSPSQVSHVTPVDSKVAARLKIEDGIHVWVVQSGEFFRGDLVVTDPSGASSSYPVTEDYDNVEALIARLHVVKLTVQVLLGAGFALRTPLRVI